jgi:hypothetical protein
MEINTRLQESIGVTLYNAVYYMDHLQISEFYPTQYIYVFI